MNAIESLIGSLDMKALEAFLGSMGILMVGMFTIPYVGKMYGAKITRRQGIYMSLTFFVLRFIWLYSLRLIFG